MSAFSAAASDEDGDTIKVLRAAIEQARNWIAEHPDRRPISAGRMVAILTNALAAAPQPPALEQPDMGNPVSVPQGWKLVPAVPTAEMLNSWCEAENKTSKHLHASDVMQAGYRAMLAAAPQPPAIEQQLRYLDGGSRYKVTHQKTSGYCVLGLPAELMGQWVALVDATDNKHMDNQHPPVAIERQYPLPDDLYGGSKDWRAGSYHERVEWLHLWYESAKKRIEELEQPQPVEMLGETCIDGGKCHHKCTDRCFRRKCCAPFSDYSGPWKYETPQPQVEQEPVAWQYRMRPDWGSKKDCWGSWQDCTKEQAAMYQRVPLLHDWAYESRPLYTRPQPPRQPLTEDGITQAFLTAGLFGPGDEVIGYEVEMVRAIERAHGIGGEE